MTTSIDPNTLKALKEEHDFCFNKEGVPEKLNPWLIEIENNRRKWKSLYMAVWGLPLYALDPLWISKGHGDDLQILVLPAAKLKYVLYTPKELKSYLTDYDRDIHINQIIKIFILLENYFLAYHQLTSGKKGRLIDRFPGYFSRWGWIKKNFKLSNNSFDPTRFRQLSKYLKNNSFASDIELSELELAKETRNCFIHGDRINKKWLKAYKKVRGKSSYKIGDKMPSPPFNDLENWTDILIKIIDNSIKIFTK